MFQSPFQTKPHRKHLQTFTSFMYSLFLHARLLDNKKLCTAFKSTSPVKVYCLYPARPWVFSYPKPHAKLMTVVLSASLPRPFKDNEYVKTVLWLYMKPLWTVWGARNETSLRRGCESSVFAEWNLSTRLFDSPRSNNTCQQWRI